MDLLATVVLWAVPIILAITLHEAAHGFVAKQFGDQTAWMLGRVTLNPLKHIDPVGTLLVPGVLLLSAKLLGGAPFLFGWAKPVPVNFANLRHPKRDMLWVAAAGPAVNFVMALGWALLLVASIPGGVWASDGLREMSRIGVSINLVLMALNLLPIPPLDGGRIAVSLLPMRAAQALSRVEPYGLFVILALVMIPGALGTILGPLVRAGEFLILAIIGRWSPTRPPPNRPQPVMFSDRVLSGMRPTGRMHIGHYHGALKNWVRLQEEYECLFFVADWHALTTHYEEPGAIAESVWDMIVDWLAAGLDPNRCTLFIQSRVPEHAELSLLLGMITPVGWLERVPTYKDQQLKLADRDLSTFGFLGYPLMQGADILIYRANMVPVGEDQVSHLELVRELARRFNHIYGREPGFEDKAKAAVKKLGAKKAKRYNELRTAFQENGDDAALEAARALLEDTQNLSLGDRERLFGWLEGSRRVILPEPQPLLTATPKVPGLDGMKMSKSYGNAIMLREEPAEVTRKIRTMQTDPARARRTDPGNPEKCPVWPLHKIYSDAATQDWVVKGCTTAGIGCLECKQPVIDAILAEQAPMRERAQKYLDDPQLVRNIVADGCERARKLAEETMADVREAMGLKYD